MKIGRPTAIISVADFVQLVNRKAALGNCVDNVRERPVVVVECYLLAVSVKADRDFVEAGVVVETCVACIRDMMSSEPPVSEAWVALRHNQRAAVSQKGLDAPQNSQQFVGAGQTDENEGKYYDVVMIRRD